MCELKKAQLKRA